MSTTPEAAYAALFDRLRSQVEGINFASRQFLDWDSPKIRQPALLCVATDMVPAPRSRGLSPQWNLGATVILYLRNEGETTETKCQEFIARVHAALQLQSTETPIPGGQYETTLGDLVLWAKIDGTVEIFQGQAGTQTAVLIPVGMFVA
jgi:hypothetical protein